MTPHAALGEILANELGRVPPGYYVDEVRLPLAVLGLEVPVAGDGEAADGEAGLGPT